jgi:L-lactate dehydrogenase complex protein LldE
MMADKRGREVALFVTCLIDLIRPDIGFSVVRVLEDAGYRVVVPPLQTCCGQPNYNGGDSDGARAVARRTIDCLQDHEYVVVPSGSCGGMIRHHYPLLLADDGVYAEKSKNLAGRVYELSTFLVEIAGYRPKRRELGTVTYHDGCAGLRELGIKRQPRTLLMEAGAEIVECNQAEVCCGFGGTFCVKYPEISNNMVQHKVEDARASGASCLVAGDLGCILNLEGKIHREGLDMAVFHFAELLAGEDEAE